LIDCIRSKPALNAISTLLVAGGRTGRTLFGNIFGTRKPLKTAAVPRLRRYTTASGSSPT
jgi:hypothetical protein